MRASILRIAAGAVASAFMLTACGGGGNGASLPAVAAPGAPAAPTSQKSVPVQFTIVVPTPAPTTGRAPAYISPSTQSVSFAVAPQSGGSTTTAVLNCTTTCNGTIDAPVGSDIFTAKLFDATNGGGNLLAAGATVQSIVANQANTVHLTFNGVVKSIAVSLSTTQVTPGTAGSVGVTVTALDADGNTIVGPGAYVNASGAQLTITLADSDTTGNSSLSQTTVMQPSTGITLNYTAAFDANPTVTASAPGLTSSVTPAITFPPPTLTGISVWSAATSQGSITETLTGTNFAAGSTTVNAGSGITVSNVNVTSTTTLTASFNVARASFGTQNISATTASGTTTTLPFTTATGNIYTVDVTTDTTPGTPAGSGTGSGAGLVGDLRYAIVQANANPGSLITFSSSICSASAPCTIALAGPLYPISANTVIDGGTYGNVIINGGGTSRIFWADSATQYLLNLDIENGLAQGGTSGGSGGGGAGFGGCLFVNSASVSLMNDNFSGCAATGGNGGAGGFGGGGGGMGGSGVTSGGGGGLLSDGDTLGNGGAGFSGGLGGAAGTAQAPGGAGAFGQGGGLGGSGISGSTPSAGAAGGAGGFGGGGGQGGTGGNGVGGLGFTPGGAGGTGGTGGFGGGGGGGGIGGSGEPQITYGVGGGGGFGGGGGGGGLAGGAGGTVIGLSVAGGSGGNSELSPPGGGGGAAAGPAVFVVAGSLRIINSDSSGSTATAGTAGVPFIGGETNGTADATPVFNYGGTVNGSATIGPIVSALGTGLP